MSTITAKLEMKHSGSIKNQPQRKMFQNGAILHFLKSAKKLLLTVNEITYIQADHIYVRIFTKDGKQILRRSSLGSLLKILPDEHFVQTHRSFIINKNYVNAWDSKSVMIQNEIIPISRSRRKFFKKEIFD